MKDSKYDNVRAGMLSKIAFAEARLKGYQACGRINAPSTGVVGLVTTPVTPTPIAPPVGMPPPVVEPFVEPPIITTPMPEAPTAMSGGGLGGGVVIALAGATIDWLLNRALSPSPSGKEITIDDLKKVMTDLEEQMNGLRKPIEALVPTPRTDTEPDKDKDKRRRKRCAPILKLPKGKVVHFGLYATEIAALQLAAYPTRIEADLSRTSAYRRQSGQVRKWLSAMKLQMPPPVMERGLKMPGLNRDRILRPNWGPDGTYMQMDVDHIIELQLGFLKGENDLDQISNYELLDSSTNSSAGPTLDHAIQDARAKLKTECPHSLPYFWDEQPLLFELPLLVGGGMGPGQRWTWDDVKTGKHLDVYPGRPKRK